jgi:hypothetical protein
MPGSIEIRERSCGACITVIAAVLGGPAMKPSGFTYFAFIGLGSLLLATDGRAEEVPAALRANSVVLSWSDSRNVKDMSGNRKHVDQTSKIKLYVSDKGRVFSVFDRRGNRKDAKTIAEVSGSGDNYLHWHFENGALISDQTFVRGVRRVIISFSDNFRSCSLKVLHGKEAGAQNIHYRDFGSNDELEIEDISVTATDCSFQQGNVLAGGQ